MKPRLLLLVAALAIAVSALLHVLREPHEPLPGRLDLADRTGWTRHARAPGTRMILFAETALISVNPYARRPDRDLFQALLPGLAIEEAGELFSVQGKDQPVRGWARAIECPDGGWLAMMFFDATTEGPTKGRVVVEAARCLPESAPDIAWPLGDPPDLQRSAHGATESPARTWSMNTRTRRDR